MNRGINFSNLTYPYQPNHTVGATRSEKQDSKPSFKGNEVPYLVPNLIPPIKDSLYETDIKLYFRMISDQINNSSSKVFLLG